MESLRFAVSRAPYRRLLSWIAAASCCVMAADAGAVPPVATPRSGRDTNVVVGTMPATTPRSTRDTDAVAGTMPVATSRSTRDTDAVAGTMPVAKPGSTRDTDVVVGTMPATTPRFTRDTDAEAGTMPERPPRRPVHTYSIVARDPKTGELGVAVQSHWFGVGGVVPWAEAGVGAVATQAFANPGYGPRGLALMRSGQSADRALSSLLRNDEAAGVRQVAFVDARGRVAAHTGNATILHAGHKIGAGFSVQANMMLGDDVVDAMAAAYEQTEGSALADRLLAALRAAEQNGGDIRGRQSAALVVVRARASGRPWDDRVFDLRVEDHPNPVDELTRLVRVAKAYAHMNDGDVAVERHDLESALVHYGKAAALEPDNIEVAYWHAVTLATNDRVEQALPLFRRVFAADPNWVELTKRLDRPGILPHDARGQAILAQILAQAPAPESAPKRTSKRDRKRTR